MKDIDYVVWSCYILIVVVIITGAQIIQYELQRTVDLYMLQNVEQVE